MASIELFPAYTPEVGRPDRQLVLVTADSAEDAARALDSPSRYFICFVVWDEPESPDEGLLLARAVLRAGAVYVCTYGSGSEHLHDLVDDIIVAEDLETGQDDVILTTFHREEFDDTLWYVLFTAFPAPAYETDCRATVVVAINSPRYMNSLRKALAAPYSFCERVLSTKPD